MRLSTLIAGAVGACLAMGGTAQAQSWTSSWEVETAAAALEDCADAFADALPKKSVAKKMRNATRKLEKRARHMRIMVDNGFGYFFAKNQFDKVREDWSDLRDIWWSTPKARNSAKRRKAWRALRDSFNDLRDAMTDDDDDWGGWNDDDDDDDWDWDWSDDDEDDEDFEGWINW